MPATPHSETMLRRRGKHLDEDLPTGMVVPGTNTIRFRFNQTDGVVSAYRVLGWNLLTIDGRKVLPPEDFVEDAPETWTPSLPDAASIRAGQELWQTASLAASNAPESSDYLGDHGSVGERRCWRWRS